MTRPKNAAPVSALPTPLRAWLRKWHRRRAVHGRCFAASFEGLKLFQELRPVVGVTAYQPSRDIGDFQGAVHCWLVTPEGGVLDPTRHQYMRFASGLDYWPFLAQPSSPDDLEANRLRLLQHLGIGYPPDPWTDPDGVRTWLTRAVGWTRPIPVPPVQAQEHAA
jgi:hypothetical protein